MRVGAEHGSPEVGEMNVIDEERQGRKVGPLAFCLSLSDLAMST